MTELHLSKKLSCYLVLSLSQGLSRPRKQHPFPCAKCYYIKERKTSNPSYAHVILVHDKGLGLVLNQLIFNTNVSVQYNYAILKIIAEYRKGDELVKSLDNEFDSGSTSSYLCVFAPVS